VDAASTGDAMGPCGAVDTVSAAVAEDLTLPRVNKDCTARVVYVRQRALDVLMAAARDHVWLGAANALPGMLEACRTDLPFTDHARSSLAQIRQAHRPDGGNMDGADDGSNDQRQTLPGGTEGGSVGGLELGKETGIRGTHRRRHCHSFYDRM
jgi:hypothetical protein